VRPSLPSKVIRRGLNAWWAFMLRAPWLMFI